VEWASHLANLRTCDDQVHAGLFDDDVAFVEIYRVDVSPGI
jgi:hypothetical protein